MLGSHLSRRKASAWSRRMSVFAVLAVGVLGLSACSTIDKVKSAIQDIHGNKAVVDSFNSKLNTAPTTFEANYTTTGSAPATVTYAAQYARRCRLHADAHRGSGDTAPVHLVQNSSGQYGCQQNSSGQWSCAKLTGTSSASENSVIDFYTPGHWQKFLSGLALAAGFAGDKVSTSTMSLNGFDMSCIDLVAPRRSRARAPSARPAKGCSATSASPATPPASRSPAIRPRRRLPSSSCRPAPRSRR